MKGREKRTDIQTEGEKCIREGENWGEGRSKLDKQKRIKLILKGKERSLKQEKSGERKGN